MPAARRAARRPPGVSMPIRMTRSTPAVAAVLALALVGSTPHATQALESDTLTWRRGGAPVGDTLQFGPTDTEPGSDLLFTPHTDKAGEDRWMQAPFGEGLLTDLDRWRDFGRSWRHDDVIVDYNRVDPLRLGLHVEYGPTEGPSPRFGGRLEYAFGRERWLYGIQVEQPLVPSGRFGVGVSMARRTDHSELQQIEDEENSLALLFGRQDYRDYFEREGAGVYLQWRVPDFSTVSVHLRQDTWRSLPVHRGTRSWFHADRTLRDNPRIDDGDTRTVTLRLERLLRRSAHRRAGAYHWLELERAGGPLGGDFEYTRALGDLRNVLRLSPNTTLSLRTVVGSALDGQLPLQKTFPLGGVDGLRGHRFGEYRGDQIALAQAEYTIGLWRMASDLFEGGLHAIVFIDTGRAWTNPNRRWDIARQKLQADGGFGFSTSEDNVRVYLARNLQEPGADYVMSLRLQRPF
jgi:surface antigen Omp85-like protein